VVVAKHTKSNFLSTQFPLCIINGDAQHLLAIAHTSFRIIHDDEAEAHKRPILRRISQQDMPDDCLSYDSRERIHIIILVLLLHLLRLSREFFVPVGTPKPEGVLVLAPTQYG
jgi:hypothetical protein